MCWWLCALTPDVCLDYSHQLTHGYDGNIFSTTDFNPRLDLLDARFHKNVGTEPSFLLFLNTRAELSDVLRWLKKMGERTQKEVQERLSRRSRLQSYLIALKGSIGLLREVLIELKDLLVIVTLILFFFLGVLEGLKHSG
jgi:hypothetical protein